MKKKKFTSGIPEHTDTSNCGLETECRVEKDFEAYVYGENIRVINHNAHSAIITDIVGVYATGSETETSDKDFGDLRGIMRGYLFCFFNKCSLYGYTYSKDHKFLRVSKGGECWTVNRDDLVNICKYVINGEMTPVIMRSIITLMDKDEVSVGMFDSMVEYAME